MLLSLASGVGPAARPDLALLERTTTHEAALLRALMRLYFLFPDFFGDALGLRSATVLRAGRGFDTRKEICI